MEEMLYNTTKEELLKFAAKMDKPQLVDFIIDHYTTKEIINLMAEIIHERSEMAARLEAVALSQEEYDKVLSMFRVRGIKADGSVETRGRKVKK